MCMPSASKFEAASTWRISNFDVFFPQANHGDYFDGSLTLVMNVVPVQLQKPGHIAKVVGKCLKDGKMMNNWGDITQYCLLHFARKEDAGRPATASYGAGIVAGARKGGVQLPAGTSQS